MYWTRGRTFVQQTTIAIGDIQFALAQNSDIDHLKATALAAVQNGAGFLHFTVVGNREVSVLLPAGTIVIFTTGEVPEDRRDSGDLNYPYESETDL